MTLLFDGIAYGMLLFVLADGWHLIVRSLAASFQ